MSDYRGTIKHAAGVCCKSRFHTMQHLALAGESGMQSGCAVAWAAAREPLDNKQQHQLESNGPAEINAHIDGRTRPAGQKTLMVFIKTGHDQGAKDSQNRSAAPERPMSDRHAVKRLPPTVKKSQTDQSVTDEVTGLPDDMVYLLPVCRRRGPEQPRPHGIEPSAGVRCRHGSGGLESDHQNAQRGWEPVQYPVQDWMQPEMIHVSDYKGAAVRRIRW
jgi:hypothetical protein